MAKADGSVVIAAELDNKELNDEIKKSKREIESLQKQLTKTGENRLPLEDSAKGLEKNLEAAKNKAEELKAEYTKLEDVKNNYSFNDKDAVANAIAATERQTEITAEIATAEKETEKLQKKMDGVSAALQKSHEKSSKLEEELGQAKIQAASLEKELANRQALQPLRDELNATEKKVEKFGRRVGTMFKRVFVFSILLSALRSVKSYFGEVVQKNDEAAAAMARLRGALLTMAQPIVEFVIPIFVKLINVITTAVQVLANATSLLFGKRVKNSADNAKALNKERKAIAGVGSAAKKATAFLASFDEINKVPENDGSGGGSSSSGVSADFSGFNADGIQSELDKLTAILGGALFAVGAVLAFSGANIPMGITLMALGAAILYKEASLNWEQLPQLVRDVISGVLTLVGITALTVGLFLALSGANIPLGLGLVALGAASIVSAAALNWDSLGNTVGGKLGQIGVIIGVSIAAVGVILMLTGHIPLGVGMLIAGVALFSVSEAAINWDSLGTTVKEKLGNIATTIGALVAVLGVILMLSGVARGVGLAMVLSGAVLFTAGSIAANWDSVPDTVSAKLGLVLKIVGGVLAVLGIILMLACPPLFSVGLGMVGAGATIFGASAVAENWNFISQKVRACWDAVKNYYHSNIKQYLSISYWKNKAADIINGLVSGIKNGLTSIKNAVSGVFENAWNGASKNFSHTSGGTRSSVSVQSVQATPARIYTEDIPALAKGAVIPANRRFMAVLGDQTNGNNLEAPESLIRRIVREESGGGDTATLAILREILDAVLAGHVIELDRRKVGETARQEQARQNRAYSY